jgi:hypothetical protein
MLERKGSAVQRLIGKLTGRDELKFALRSLQEIAALQQQQSAMVQTRLKALSDLVSQRATGKDASEILHAVRALVALIEEGSFGAATPDEERPSTTKLFRALDDVARGDAPILVGPWTGEIGFELLYWIPFLEWFRTRWRVQTERLVILSRGGVESWYGMPGARYVDILSLMSPSVFRQRADHDKQRRLSPFDNELVSSALQQSGVNQFTHLHPQLMYRAFGPFWKDEAGFGLISRFTNNRRLEPVGDPVMCDLPDEFVAVRFYFSNCFPEKPGNRAAVEALVSALAERTHVVILSPGDRVDDHADYVPDARGRVMTVPAGPPERNLALQSAVISRASAFVGTYGGYSYIAPFYGVPSVGFYSQQSFKLHHLYVAQRVLEQLDSATITAVNIEDADFVHAATSGATRLRANTAVDVERSPV